MRATETALFAVSFALISGGVWIELHRVRQVERRLGGVRSDLTAPTVYERQELPTRQPGLRQTAVTWKSDEAKLREAVERLASSPDPSPIWRRVGAALAILGGGSALAGSLLTIWHR